MNKQELKEIVKKEVRFILAESYLKKKLFEKLDPDDERNLHGDSRTQRQFVIDLASKNPMGIISIADIAEALNTTRYDVRSYARMIRDASWQKDFVKIIPGVPFKYSAVYQLVSMANRAPISKDDKKEIESNQKQKYKETEGVFYPIIMYDKTGRNTVTLAYLNLPQGDDIKKYKKELPNEIDLYGDKYKVVIGNMLKYGPRNEKDLEKVIGKNQFEDFIQDELMD